MQIEVLEDAGDVSEMRSTASNNSVLCRVLDEKKSRIINTSRISKEPREFVIDIRTGFLCQYC